MMTDKKLICADCGAEFVFSVNEQKFFEEKGLTNSPKRCSDCRIQRKAHNTSEKTDKKLYPAVCSRCSKNFHAPFEPKSDRIVLCRECFRGSHP